MDSSLLGVIEGLFVRTRWPLRTAKFGQTISHLENPARGPGFSDRLNKMEEPFIVSAQRNEASGVKSFCRGKPIFYSLRPLRKVIPCPWDSFTILYPEWQS